MHLLPRPQRDDRFNVDIDLQQPFQSFEMVKQSELLQQQQQKQRIAIFIDAGELFHAAMQLNIEIDYTKLLRCLTRERQLFRAYFYTGIDSSNEKQQGFLLWMRHHNYRVVSKELVQFPDGSKKANLDIEMTVDMLNLAQYCDTIVILSGDGNLTYAIDNIAYRGTNVEVVSLASMTSKDLINVADCHIDLKQIKQDIQKD